MIGAVVMVTASGGVSLVGGNGEGGGLAVDVDGDGHVGADGAERPADVHRGGAVGAVDGHVGVDGVVSRDDDQSADGEVVGEADVVERPLRPVVEACPVEGSASQPDTVPVTDEVVFDAVENGPRSGGGQAASLAQCPRPARLGRRRRRATAPGRCRRAGRRSRSVRR